MHILFLLILLYLFIYNLFNHIFYFNISLIIFKKNYYYFNLIFQVSIWKKTTFTSNGKNQLWLRNICIYWANTQERLLYIKLVIGKCIRSFHSRFFYSVYSFIRTSVENNLKRESKCLTNACAILAWEAGKYKTKQ